MEDQEKKTVSIPDNITVGELAERVDTTVSKLITELMRGGIMATVNQKIDFDTAQIIVEELDTGITLEKEVADTGDKIAARKDRVMSKQAQERPPIVAVMGHVDHGKTSLLDAIRGSDVADGEAGGITQHISAYQVEREDRKITFLDTPGHEAFAALREHGAQLTDVAVIVVAADDGIKPQTKEAIKFAAKAGVKIVVALNKMDKEGANPDRAKQQLTDEGLQPEEWGGSTVVMPVSAKTKEGIPELLDMILLVTDVEELKAEQDVPAEGLVIEAHMEKGRGPVATVLVEHGFLKKGAILVAGDVIAKVRTLENHKGDILDQAGPATPVIVTGFKDIPRFGDVFTVVKDEKTARLQAEETAIGRDKHGEMASTSSQLLKMISKKHSTTELPIVLRADVQGSLKSVIDSLNGLEHEEVAARVIGSGIGNISENDVMMAATSSAVIYGFNVELPLNVKRLAAREKVPIRVYKVIYELIDDVKELMSDLLSDETVVEEIGRLKIKGIFRTTQNQVICGGQVIEGFAKPNTKARVMRDDEQIGEADVTSVKQQSQEVKEMPAPEMCGLQLSTNGKLVLKEGDYLDFYTSVTQARTL